MSIRNKRLMAENKGSTLIEVIVSVLIMGIVFVPLLIGMTTALKANNVSESKMYADNVASKCVEILKSSASLGGVQAAFVSAGVSAGDVNISNGSGTVKNLKEGTKTYTAQISIDADNATLAGINNPADYKSVDSISGAWSTMGVDVDYAALCEFVSRLKTGTASPIEMIQYLAEKNVTVHIFKATDEDHKDMYGVQTTVTYIMGAGENGNDKFVNNTLEVSETPQYYKSLPEGFLIFTSPITTVEGMNASGTSVSQALYDFCKAESTKPEEFPEKSTYNIVDSNLKQTFDIWNEITDLKGNTEENGSKLNIYFFMSGSDISKAYNNADTSKNPAGCYSSFMKLAVTDSSVNPGVVNVYSPLQFASSNSSVSRPTGWGTNAYNAIGTLLKEAVSSEITKLYKVNVKITNDTTGEVEATLDSTVVYK